MSGIALFSAQQDQQLRDWLAETGELCVDVYLPRSAGGGVQYFVQSLEQLEQLISNQRWGELVITIFRRLQYPLRGIANDELLKHGLEMIPDGKWYTMVLLENFVYPNKPRWFGSGKTHAEFRQEFSEMIGHQVGIGQNPFDLNDDWLQSTSDEAMVLYFKKRENHYEPELV